MDLLINQDLLCTAKSMVLCFAEIIFGGKKHPNKTLKVQNLHPGLKTLIHKKLEEEEEEEKSHRHGQPEMIIIHSYMVSKLPPLISPSPALSSSSLLLSKSSQSSSCSSIVLDSSSSSSMGDLIGTESGVYMSSNEEEILKPIERRTSASYTGRFNGRYWDRRNAVEKEYPPPIPSLARTGHLQSRMPWVFTREYTHDGRLILREKRVQRHEYFYAHRENGRLILKLIPVDEQDEKNNEEGYDNLELEDDLQFVEQDKGKQKMVGEKEEMKNENDQDEDEYEDEIPKFPKQYVRGMFMDSKQCFCYNSVKVHESPHIYLDQSSTSSSVPLRPMAAAM